MAVINFNQNEGPDIRLQSPRELERAIFELISQLASLLFIDISDIECSVTTQKNGSLMLRCRICNVEYSQPCSSTVLIDTEPDIIAAAFFTNMMNTITKKAIQNHIHEKYNAPDQ